MRLLSMRCRMHCMTLTFHACTPRGAGLHAYMTLSAELHVRYCHVPLCTSPSAPQVERLLIPVGGCFITFITLNLTSLHGTLLSAPLLSVVGSCGRSQKQHPLLTPPNIVAYVLR